MDRYLHTRGLRTNVLKLLKNHGLRPQSLLSRLITVMVSSAPLHAIDIVHDPTSFKTFEAIFSQAKESVGVLNHALGEIQGMNAALGNKIPAGLMNRLTQGFIYGQEFDGLMDAFNSPGGDPLSKMNYIGQQHAGTQDFSNYLYAQQYFKHKFFPEQQTTTQLQAAHTGRQEALETTTVDSLALSTQQKKTLAKDHQTLKDLGTQANQDDTLRYQTTVQTKLLQHIAHQLDKLVALQAQQLQLMATSQAQSQPVVFRRVGGQP